MRELSADKPLLSSVSVGEDLQWKKRSKEVDHRQSSRQPPRIKGKKVKKNRIRRIIDIFEDSECNQIPEMLKKYNG